MTLKTQFRLICTLVLWLPLPILADGKYTTDSEVNSALHATETTWNKTYGATSPDYQGNMKDISETATSPEGTVTVTLTTDDVTYMIDFGTLDFDALDPIQATEAYFSLQVNKIEASGSGSVRVSGPAGQSSYACNNVRMGIKNFLVTGHVNVEETVTFSNIVFVIDDADYYFTYPCTLSLPQFAQALSINALSKEHARLLKQDMSSQNSQWSRAARKKVKSRAKKGIRTTLSAQS